MTPPDPSQNSLQSPLKSGLAEKAVALAFSIAPYGPISDIFNAAASAVTHSPVIGVVTGLAAGIAATTAAGYAMTTALTRRVHFLKAAGTQASASSAVPDALSALPKTDPNKMDKAFGILMAGASMQPINDIFREAAVFVTSSPLAGFAAGTVAAASAGLAVYGLTSEGSAARGFFRAKNKGAAPG